MIQFSDTQLSLLRGIGFTFDVASPRLTDDQYIEIEERVGDHLVLHCLDSQYNPNLDGRTCENILAALRSDD